MITKEFTYEDISQWLKNRIAMEINQSIDSISSTKSFPSYGLDSVVIVTFSVDLENYLGYELDPTIFYEFTNIDELSNWLVLDFIPSQI